MNGMLHSRAKVTRLFLPKDEGGRGLTSIEEPIKNRRVWIIILCKKRQV